MNSPRRPKPLGLSISRPHRICCPYFPLGSPWRGRVECPSRLYTVARKTAFKLPHEWLLRTPLCGTVALAWPGVCMSIHIVRRICIIHTISGQARSFRTKLAGAPAARGTRVYHGQVVQVARSLSELSAASSLSRGCTVVSCHRVVCSEISNHPSRFQV